MGSSGKTGVEASGISGTPAIRKPKQESRAPLTSSVRHVLKLPIHQDIFARTYQLHFRPRSGGGPVNRDGVLGQVRMLRTGAELDALNRDMGMKRSPKAPQTASSSTWEWMTSWWPLTWVAIERFTSSKYAIRDGLIGLAPFVLRRPLDSWGRGTSARIISISSRAANRKSTSSKPSRVAWRRRGLNIRLSHILEGSLVYRHAGRLKTRLSRLESGDQRLPLHDPERAHLGLASFVAG
jgi:hypothetical protein